jgi:hypothetical protein
VVPYIRRTASVIEKNMATKDLTRFTDNQDKLTGGHPLLASQYTIIMTAAVICCIGLAGCGDYISPNPADQMPDKSGMILSERLGSAKVRNTLGNPLITSRYWGVEVFRDANSQIDIPFAFFIPFGMLKDDIYRYTLVSYDNEQTAKYTASGIHRKQTHWRPPIEYNNVTIDLHAGDFTFVAELWDGYETLLVSPARRDIYLESARQSQQCTVVIGCGTGECSSKLRVDNGPTLALPYRLKMQNFDANALELLRQGKHEDEKSYRTKTFDTVAALSLSPGSHTLTAWGGRWMHSNAGPFIGGEKSINFSCREGEILYIVIEVSAKEYDWWSTKGVWKIDLLNEMPEFFADRHLVLYRGDKWLVKSE